jgi:hypothetical protein
MTLIIIFELNTTKIQQNTTNLVPLLTMREILKMAKNFSQMANKSLKILANNY